MALEAAGWDAQVKTTLAHGDIVRTSDTVVTITLPAVAGYSVTANETITVTIPANNLTAAGIVVATPTFEVTADPVTTAALTGTLSDNATEAEIVAGGETLIITLTNDTWIATIGDDNAFTTGLIAGIDSAQAEATGWDAVVKAGMDYNDVARTNDTTVTVTLSAEATYDISDNETITVTIPSDNLVTSDDPVIATPTIAIIFFDQSTEKITGITMQ